MTIVCNCPARCELHPKPKSPTPIAPAGSAPSAVQNPTTPIIASDDSITLLRLHASWLKARLDVREAQTQLELFGSVLYEKHGVTQHDWALDFAGPSFVPRLK